MSICNHPVGTSKGGREGKEVGSLYFIVCQAGVTRPAPSKPTICQLGHVILAAKNLPFTQIFHFVSFLV